MKFTDEQRKSWLAGLDKRFSSSAVLLENSQGDLLIVKSDYKPHWSLPGGIIDAGESPIEAAIREVFEETNIKISKDELRFVALASRKSLDYMMHHFIFQASLEDEKFANIKLQESEIEACRFIKKSEISHFDGELLWVIPYWATQQFGYFETKIEDEDGSKKESVTFHLPFE